MPLHDAVTPGEAPAGLSPRGVESKEAGGGCPGHPSSPLLPPQPRPGPSPGPNAAAAPYCPGVGGGGRLLIRAFRSLHCSALGLPPTPQDTAVRSLGCAVSPYTPLSPCRGPLKCHLLPKPFSIALPRPCFDHGTNPNTHTCTHTHDAHTCSFAHTVFFWGSFWGQGLSGSVRPSRKRPGFRSTKDLRCSQSAKPRLRPGCTEREVHEPGSGQRGATRSGASLAP